MHRNLAERPLAPETDLQHQGSRTQLTPQEGGGKKPFQADETSLCEAGTINAAQQNASLTAEIDFQRLAATGVLLQQDTKENVTL